MATSATPVQLVDPNTGTSYSSAPPTNQKVNIDQTTPGTTNGVVVNSSTLPAGAGTAANQVALIGNQTNGTQVTKLRGTDNISTGQVAVATSSTLVVAARAGRQKVTLSPTTSTVYYVGGSGVTSGNGLYVAAGGITTLDTTAAVYALGASALTISFIEYF